MRPAQKSCSDFALTDIDISPYSCCSLDQPPYIHLLQRNEPRRVRSTNTRSTVLDRLIRDRELAQIVTHHLRLDLNRVELLPRVNTNDAADHLGDDNHISEVCLDDVGFLVGLGFLLGFSQFLDQTHWSALEASVKPTAGAGMEDVEEFVGWNVEESVEFVSGWHSGEMMDATYWSRSMPR